MRVCVCVKNLTVYDFCTDTTPYSSDTVNLLHVLCMGYEDQYTLTGYLLQLCQIYV